MAQGYSGEPAGGIAYGCLCRDWDSIVFEGEVNIGGPGSSLTGSYTWGLGNTDFGWK